MNIQHIYSGKNHRKLIIVFQAGGIEWYNEDLFRNRNRSEEDFQKYTLHLNQVHNRYNYYKYFLEHNFDVLSIADNFCLSFGWYLLDNKHEIKNQIADFIQNFCDLYDKENIYYFGSSKGAFGALLISSILKKCRCVISLFPVINPEQFYSEYEDRIDFRYQLELLKENYSGNKELGRYFESNINLSNAVPVIAIIGKNEYLSYRFLKKLNFTSRALVYFDLRETDHSGYLSKVMDIVDYIFENEIYLREINQVSFETLNVFK